MRSERSSLEIARGYDVVGDIHGHADALSRLLTRLDYREDASGVFRHPSRTVIFVGDYIDRGPQQRETLRILCSMCAAGAAQAIMGNHEFNAIGWSLRDGKDRFLRPHTPENARQHAAFLREFPEGSPAYEEAIAWFRTLPLWISLPGLRVVHACWHEPSQAILSRSLDEQHRLPEDGLEEFFLKGSEIYAATEILLKGPEQQLPPGVHFVDKDGRRRTEVRLRWWDESATTYRRAAIGFEDRLDDLPDIQLPRDFRCSGADPILFGHYWLMGKPTLSGAAAGCLDFSVAKGGHLSCYRWSGERHLLEDRLVSVEAEEA